MKKYFLLYLVVLSSTIFAAKTRDDTTTQIESLKEEVNFLNSWLSDRLDNIEKDHDDLQDRVMDLEIKASAHDSVVFNLKEDSITKKFQIISNGSETFFISLDNAIPELGGYRLTFSIGNPLMATYNNAKLKIKWNRSFQDHWLDPAFKKKKDDYEKAYAVYAENKPDSVVMKPEYPKRTGWRETTKEQEFSILKALQPGSWNSVSVHLTPATLEYLGYVEVFLETSRVQLKPSLS